MCGTDDNGACNCGHKSEPELMRRMAGTLGVGGLLSGEQRDVAADRCSGCTEREQCEDFLSLAAVRGAERAPSFCRNADLFDKLASEVPGSP